MHRCVMNTVGIAVPVLKRQAIRINSANIIYFTIIQCNPNVSNFDEKHTCEKPTQMFKS